MSSPFNLDSFMAEINERFDLDNDQTRTRTRPRPTRTRTPSSPTWPTTSRAHLEQNLVTDTDTIAGDGGAGGAGGIAVGGSSGSADGTGVGGDAGDIELSRASRS